MKLMILILTVIFSGQIFADYSYVIENGKKIEVQKGLNNTPQQVEPDREIPVLVQFRKYIVKKTKRGIKISFKALCQKKGKSPVYDLRDGGIIIVPGDGMVNCVTTYQKKKIKLSLDHFMTLTHHSPFENKADEDYKGFFSHFYTRSIDTVFLSDQDFSLPSSKEMDLESQLIELSISGVATKSDSYEEIGKSLKPGEQREGFLAAIEFYDR